MATTAATELLASPVTTLLHDENALSVEDVHRLTFHLGFMLGRSTRSTSFVAPVYFARLAARRARCCRREVPDGLYYTKDEFTDPHDGVRNGMFSYSGWVVDAGMHK